MPPAPEERARVVVGERGEVTSPEARAVAVDELISRVDVPVEFSEKGKGFNS